MTHLVIVHTTEEKSFFPCEGLDVAIATIERFRNEQNVESCELFELNPISFEFRPYYHVALSTGPAESASMSSVAVDTTAPSGDSLSDAGVSDFDASEATAPDAASELSVPVLAAVESPNPFDNAVEPPAPAAVAETPFTTSFDAADQAPSDLDRTLSDAGVPSAAAIPPLPEAIPPAPAFSQPTPVAAPDPFTQSPSEAASDAPSGFGFELDPSAQPGGFELAEETPEVAELFGSGAELPPPPPPPPLDEVVKVVEEPAPKRGLFGR